MHTETERAWLAGFIDGEGNIGITHIASTGPLGKRHVLRVTVTNTHVFTSTPRSGATSATTAGAKSNPLPTRGHRWLLWLRVDAFARQAQNWFAANPTGDRFGFSTELAAHLVETSYERLK